LHLDLTVCGLRFHGRFRHPFAFTHLSTTQRRVRELFFSCGTQGKWGHSARRDTGLQRLLLRPRARLRASMPSVAPHSNKRLLGYLQEQENLRRGREGRRGWPQSHPEGHRRADALCKVSLLATKLEASRPQRKTLPQDEEQLRCTSAHPERGGAEERQSKAPRLHAPFRLFDVAMRALIVHRLWYGFKLPIGWAVPQSSALAIAPPPPAPAFFKR
jgi:hypothetical protein